jgi:hypothetical protein
VALRVTTSSVMVAQSRRKVKNCRARPLIAAEQWMSKVSAWMVAAALSLFLVSFAQAQNANMIDIGPAAGDARAYFLKDTIKQVSPTIRSARIILSYKTARFGLDKNFNDDPNQRHLSYGSTYYANCTAHTTAQSGNALYSEGMGAGTIVKSFPNDVPPSKFY